MGLDPHEVMGICADESKKTVNENGRFPGSVSYGGQPESG
jgi:hypothetical protein